MQNGDWTGGGTEEALMLLKGNDELWHKKFEDTVTLQGLGSSTGKKERLLILSDSTLCLGKGTSTMPAAAQRIGDYAKPIQGTMYDSIEIKALSGGYFADSVATLQNAV